MIYKEQFYDALNDIRSGNATDENLRLIGEGYEEVCAALRNREHEAELAETERDWLAVTLGQAKGMRIHTDDLWGMIEATKKLTIKAALATHKDLSSLVRRGLLTEEEAERMEK